MPKRAKGATSHDRQAQFPTAIYDLQHDPEQRQPIDDPEVEARMRGYLGQLMRDNDAPPEQFARLGLTNEN